MKRSANTWNRCESHLSVLRTANSWMWSNCATHVASEHLKDEDIARKIGKIFFRTFDFMVRHYQVRHCPFLLFDPSIPCPALSDPAFSAPDMIARTYTIYSLSRVTWTNCKRIRCKAGSKPDKTDRLHYIITLHCLCCSMLPSLANKRIHYRINL